MSMLPRLLAPLAAPMLLTGCQAADGLLWVGQFVDSAAVLIDAATVSDEEDAAGEEGGEADAPAAEGGAGD